MKKTNSKVNLRIWSKVFFNITKDNNDYWKNYFIENKKYFYSSEFKYLCNNAIINKSDKLKILEKLFFNNFKEDDKKTLVSFLKVLFDYKKINYLGKIAENYIKKSLDFNNIKQIYITSSSKIEKIDLNLEKYLKSVFSASNFEYYYFLDKSIIGGIQVRCEGKVLDLSIKNRIDILKSKII